MNAEDPKVGKRLMELRRSAKSRRGLVLWRSSINSAGIPAVNLKCGDPVLFCVGCERRQLIKAMNDRVLAVRQNNGLPRILLTQPTARTRDVKVLVEPCAIDSAGGVPISSVHLQRHRAGCKRAFARVGKIDPTHGQSE